KLLCIKQPDALNETIANDVRYHRVDRLVTQAYYSLVVYDLVADNTPVKQLGVKVWKTEPRISIELGELLLASHGGRRCRHFVDRDVIAISCDESLQIMCVVRIELPLDYLCRFGHGLLVRAL